jgi:MerR family transcriptional regulator, copper efflux regulator
MLISKFAQAMDTVRFYVRRGLLKPETNGKGGRKHVRTARIIRTAQSLGMSLKEIAAISEEYSEGGGLSRERSIEIMGTQLQRLDQKAAELDAMAAYLRAKLARLGRASRGRNRISTIVRRPAGEADAKNLMN